MGRSRGVVTRKIKRHHTDSLNGNLVEYVGWPCGPCANHTLMVPWAERDANRAERIMGLGLDSVTSPKATQGDAFQKPEANRAAHEARLSRAGDAGWLC